jgi:hypothetical protein
MWDDDESEDEEDLDHLLWKAALIAVELQLWRACGS